MSSNGNSNGVGINDEQKTSLIEFPAHLSVKAMGLQSRDFESLVVDLVSKVIAPQKASKVSAHESSAGKYVSIRVYFIAHSEAELTLVYQALRDEARVLFTL